VFNKVVGDSGFELDMAAFLDGCVDIISFVKNSQSTQFRMEYRNADGSIANYYPDFLVKRTDVEIWVIETKGEMVSGTISSRNRVVRIRVGCAFRITAR
jgi:type III restriction enzyme